MHGPKNIENPVFNNDIQIGVPLATFGGFREHILFVIKLLNALLISLIAVFIFLPIFVHHWRWVYSQCKSRITKLCCFF
jgi:hypothetical protein